MKAWALDGYGRIDRFGLRDLPTPEPDPAEVRVRVRAIGINPLDAKLRSGSLQDQMPLRFPAVLGIDVAGIVDAVGAEVDGLAVGDRVVGLAGRRAGAYAEFALARADQLAPIPDGLDDVHAATIPTAAETARRVISQLHPERGETVVVSGGAGSVGSTAVQLLLRIGVRVVATAGPGNQDYLRALGAWATTYGDGVEQRIRDLAPHGVDAVFDVAGRDFTEVALDLRGGPDRVVTIADFDAAARGVEVSWGDSDAIRATDFAPVVELAAAGTFRAEVAVTHAFEDLPAAHQASERGHVRGKIVVLGPGTDVDLSRGDW